MTVNGRKVGRGSPPLATRFQKGVSGNPNGRPKAKVAHSGSAFDIVIDRTLTITQGGQQREVTIDEALQHRTYQDAIAGSRPARREILKMIEKREKARVARTPTISPVEIKSEKGDPRNADDAMLILGIASDDPRQEANEKARLVLEPWAVQAAIDRARGRRFSSRERDNIRACMSSSDMIRWPPVSEG